MILKQYIDEVKVLLKQTMDESYLDERLIASLIHSQRALFIKNEVNGGKTVEDNIIQSIGNLRVEPVSGFTLYDAKVKLLKSIQKIPKLINFKERLAIERLRVEGTFGYNITIIDKASSEWVNNIEYTENDLYAYLDKGFIYLVVPKTNFKASLITYLELEGVFENPLQVSYFSDLQGNSFYNIIKDDYPINHALWEYMLGEILRKLQLPLSLSNKLENDQREAT